MLFKECYKNVCGVFECLVDMIGKNIVLIDDVMIIGVMLNECVWVFKLYGVNCVMVVVVVCVLKY